MAHFVEGCRRFTPTHVGKMLILMISQALICGSPPRTWGKWMPKMSAYRLPWFTPTHVGKIDRRGSGRNRRAVHPHARGENLTKSSIASFVSGSPPRTWGKCLRQLLLGVENRFTPTHVGKIKYASNNPADCPVHPHARGENGVMSISRDSSFGSPPRTWGKYVAAGLAPAPIRFTPTHVGKIPESRPYSPGSPVHPHARGENLLEYIFTSSSSGSPPRTWGK